MTLQTMRMHNLPRNLIVYSMDHAPCAVRQSPFFNPQLVYGTPDVPGAECRPPAAAEVGSAEAPDRGPTCQELCRLLIW